MRLHLKISLSYANGLASRLSPIVFIYIHLDWVAHEMIGGRLLLSSTELIQEEKRNKLDRRLNLSLSSSLLLTSLFIEKKLIKHTINI